MLLDSGHHSKLLFHMHPPPALLPASASSSSEGEEMNELITYLNDDSIKLSELFYRQKYAATLEQGDALGEEAGDLHGGAVYSEAEEDEHIEYPYI